MSTSNANMVRARKSKYIFDFGPDNAWESHLSQCIHNLFGGYNYTFCFFGDIKQGNHILLGRFSNWGGRSDRVRVAQVDEGNGAAGLIESTVDMAGQMVANVMPEYLQVKRKLLFSP